MLPQAFMLSTVLLVTSCQAAHPGQASNFNVTASVAQEHDCDSKCQATLEETNEGDLAIFGSGFDFDFYATASNFSTSKPGDVLKIQPITSPDLSVPAGVTIFKMQYTSVDLNGSLVPSTGFAAFPFARTQSPFNLVAYAHGTSGVFRGCAPSTSSVLFDYTSWTPLVLAGYAVVATDYAGLGNNYTAHKYLSSSAQANDVYYSVVAAQKAFPEDLSHEWVSIGHSQGGGAAWKLSEHELVQDEKSGYRGGVAVAPVTKLYDDFALGFTKLRNVSDIHSYYILGEIPSSALGVKAVFPDYDFPLLTETMKKRIQLAEIGQYCDVAISGLTRDLTLEQMIATSDITKDERMKEFQHINAPAQGDKASEPLLLIQGVEDTIVFQESTVMAFNESCNHGNAIHLSLYPGLDHSASLTASSPEWLKFISDRFEHKNHIRECLTKVVNPFDLTHASKPTDTV